MFKLSQFLLSRSPISEQLLLRKAGMKDVICLHNLTSRAGISTAGNYSDRVFADYTLFKGKAFLSVRPNLPELSRLDSGDSKVSRRGCIFLTFCPAVGQRKYDYEKRQIFSLSPTEVGALISLGPNDSCEFFHDPSIQTSNAGQLRKSLSVSSLPSTGGPSTGGYMFSLNVVNNNLKTNERFSVPVTIAEFAVMRTAFSFALPHIMGWNWLSNQAKTSKDGYRRTPTLMSSDLEWEK